MAILILILKTRISLVSTRPDYTKINKNKAYTNGNSNINSGRINNKILNLLSSIKVIKNYKIGFFYF